MVFEILPSLEGTAETASKSRRRSQPLAVRTSILHWRRPRFADVKNPQIGWPV